MSWNYSINVLELEMLQSQLAPTLSLNYLKFVRSNFKSKIFFVSDLSAKSFNLEIQWCFRNQLKDHLHNFLHLFCTGIISQQDLGS